MRTAYSPALCTWLPSTVKVQRNASTRTRLPKDKIIHHRVTVSISWQWVHFGVLNPKNKTLLSLLVFFVHLYNHNFKTCVPQMTFCACIPFQPNCVKWTGLQIPTFEKWQIFRYSVEINLKNNKREMAELKVSKQSILPRCRMNTQFHNAYTDRSIKEWAKW